MVWLRGTFMKMCIVMMMCPRRIRPYSLSSNNTVETEREHLKAFNDDEMNTVSNNPPNSTDIEVFPFDEQPLDLNESEMERFKMWPRGIIPYFIDDFSFDKVLRDRIRKSMDICNSVTGIQFIELPRPPDDSDRTRWVFIINRMGQLDCLDYPTSSFTNQGVQKIVLGYDCLEDTGNMAGIFLSLIGVPPQHNAPNRDDYIEVAIENVLSDKRHLFDKVSESDWPFHNHPYDFASASHYDFYAYTANGLATITPKTPVDEPVGEAKSLSKYDIKKIKMLYSNQINKNTTYKAAQCSKLYRLRSDFSGLKFNAPKKVLSFRDIGDSDQKPIKL